MHWLLSRAGGQWTATDVTTNDPAGALAFGVYQFTKETWAELLKLADNEGLTADQIKFPTAQCVVAAVLAAKSASLLKGLITDRGVSAVDLYLAHMFSDDKSFGSNATAKFLEAEKTNAGQASVEVVKQIYPDDAVRDAFLQRNQAIFNANGSATIATALENCTKKLADGFKEVEKLANEIKKSIPADVDDPIFGVQFSGNVITITDQDVDALARVSESEVGNFGQQFGVNVLTDALAAVVDTIFNRSIYPSKEFPKTIQGVIDQSQQFSAINAIGTWKHLPEAPAAHFQIVLNHIQGRAKGAASKIGGATHFFNPTTSHPSWGPPIAANPIARYGTAPNSHVHGFPDGYHPPEGHAIQLGKDAWVFSGDGKPQGSLITPDKSTLSIVAAATKEWDFWGNSVPGKIHHTDNEPAFATYVLETYCRPLGATPSLSAIANDTYFWSAVAISCMVKQSGVSASEFTFSQSHSTYIREAIKARRDKDKSKAYWGFRIDETEAVLAPGDIVGAGRTKGMTFEQAQALFDKKTDYESHSDIVVAVRAGEADLIGGNVSDSVTKKTLKLDAKGRLRDKKNLSFVVMKKN
jgi:spore germination cell wall hydrolase CwlJ-like protein